ncbi:vascular endothelial growth factor C-like [Salarias fasciatus]|uniref:vascular endothelial growth factor C-like n=1 Tax=Salarias fasciatus TaxID=181472 RepID=UPI001176A556|nr:vascular endothelial growth factor C-like [Salarias fasciatus]
MWIPAVLLWMLKICNLCSGQDYPDYYQPGNMGTQVPEVSDGSSLDSVVSVDQLLQLLYPEYSRMQQCLRRRSLQRPPSSPPSAGPLLHSSSQDLWGPFRGEALYKMDGTLEVILEEIQRTSCQPREACVEVAKEYPESTSHFYLPRCVALHRCGGCCSNEALYCANSSYSLVNKTVMQLTPRMERSVSTMAFVNHTSCECLSRRPLHSVIRRAAARRPCSPPEAACSPGAVWDPLDCACVSADATRGTGTPYLDLDQDQNQDLYQDLDLLALCGPNRVLDESSCECVCENGLTEASCEPGWKLDQNTCECQCEGQAEGTACPAGQRWDGELCGCVCAADCPGNQPLNPDTCLCQCRESPQSCLRQGKRFNPSTCSCYRLPCRKPRRTCQAGFYYSHQVCQCIPDYMRPDWK